MEILFHVFNPGAQKALICLIWRSYTGAGRWRQAAAIDRRQARKALKKRYTGR
jgi:hypothetical protein